ncbi:hypothetical protein F4553_002336 [Allocatelliglobosispora scoriae]|uniref:Uncharacterized protein n=1 Tax=Allocatelliglobosispora scoriae TaxID=643052 RepID=A0A841BIL0_9ACTN|nr:hypothetical protein [Allocatelliglobosispora scoriae]MBB5868957.1 hypothetical protein [Allocatelliglobosispora scoriae]
MAARDQHRLITTARPVPSGVEVMVKLGTGSRINLDVAPLGDGMPILEILAGDGVHVMITPWVGVADDGPLTSMDLLIADELLASARGYRNDLARALGVPAV